MSKHIEDMVKLFEDVCDLTNEKCKAAIEQYKEHGNAMVLVNEVFTQIDSCDTQKCMTNKDKIISKLYDFLEIK